MKWGGYRVEIYHPGGYWPSMWLGQVRSHQSGPIKRALLASWTQPRHREKWLWDIAKSDFETSRKVTLKHREKWLWEIARKLHWDIAKKCIRDTAKKCARNIAKKCTQDIAKRCTRDLAKKWHWDIAKKNALRNRDKVRSRYREMALFR